MKEIGDFFRENFEGAENMPPSYIWENISQNVALRSYNKTQWLRKNAWYGAAVASVIIVIGVAFYIMNKNPENIPAPQKEIAIATEITPEESDTTTFENVIVSSRFSQNVHKTVELPEPEYVMHSSTISSSVTHNSSEITTHEIVQKTEDAKFVEKEQPVEISTPPTKSTNRKPSIHRVTIPDIPIKKGETLTEESKNSDPFTDIEETTHLPVFIPSAFTPNGDGLNDIFLVQTSATISDYEINIYDRSGQLVYHSKQIETGWDGTVKGGHAPQGSYIYVITFTNVEKEKVVKQGYLLLIR